MNCINWDFNNMMINRSDYRPGVPRGFQEVKVPKLRGTFVSVCVCVCLCVCVCGVSTWHC